MIYTYLVSYTVGGLGQLGVSRSVITVAQKLNTLERIEAIEQFTARNIGVPQVAMTNLVLLKRRFGRLADPIEVPAARRAEARDEKEGASR